MTKQKNPIKKGKQQSSGIGRFNRSKTYRVKNDDQLSALTVPLRQQILDVVASSVDQCSIKQISDWVGRPADSLYFHIAKLVKVGLLIECEGVMSEGKRVATYTTPSMRMRIQYDLGNPTFKKQVKKISNSIHRLSMRDYEASVDNPNARTDGTYRNVWVARNEGYLSTDSIAELNALLEKALGLFTKERTNKNDQRIAVSFSITLPGSSKND